MPSRVLLISNMFPSSRDRTYGRFVERCATGLATAGIKTDVVSLPKHSSFVTKLLDYVRFAIEANVRILLKRYDCVYVHHPLHTLLVCTPALAVRKVQLVLNFHGHDLLPVKRRGKVLQAMMSGFFRSASIVVVPSRHFKSLFDSRFGDGRPEGARIFYSGGVNDEYFAIEPPAWTSRPPSALFLSRWVAEKGWPDFIDLAKRLKHCIPDFQFTLAGVGPDESAIRAAVTQAGLAGSVNIVPAVTVEQNRTLFTGHRYFVFPTRYDESLALVNLEAMACGCVVLSTDFPTASEYIEHGVNGFRLPLAGFTDTCLHWIKALEENAAAASAITTAARITACRFRESDVMRGLPMLLEPRVP
jgi:glycosyltransferase involved in cell wall biosynthesis